jgi:hypothetical protein
MIAGRGRRWRVVTPGALVLLAVGLAFGPLLVGVEPIGGDPERLYRPVKAELARALREGRLPWWSDRFGLGVPLVAESHAAAFYPPNWLLYRLLPVHPAYRLAMWGHHVLMAAGVFCYARRLGITPRGAALAAVSFPLCGFQAIHASHEVFYHALAWLPWALFFADRYATGGRVGDLAALALVLGLQWTVGHFQIQTWTAILVVVTGLWAARATGRWIWRGMGLLRGVVWGALIAAVQIGPSWELAKFVGQENRSIPERLFYSFPPSHLSEPAVPSLFRAFDPMHTYWFGQQTSGYEACLYFGTIPLLLVFVGLLARGRELLAWKLLVPLSLALATMPRWWPEGYVRFLSIPVLGAFRAPARYTAIASLGLALLAGAGLDRLISRRRFGLGFALGVAVVLGSYGWLASWFPPPPNASHWLPMPSLVPHLIGASAIMAVALVLVLLWRAGRVPGAVLVALTTVELATLYYNGPIEWGRPLSLPGGSPVLAYLRDQPDVLSVGGELENYPVLAGKATATPYLGFSLPEPNELLKVEAGPLRGPAIGPKAGLRRLGVSHMVWPDIEENPPRRLEVVWQGQDPLLARLTDRPIGTLWSIERLPIRPVAARVAIHQYSAYYPEFSSYAQLGLLAEDEVAGFRGEALPPLSARNARLLTWEGRSGEVEHDGACVLVLTRTAYPGWSFRLDGGPPQPVISVDGGMQGIPIPGAGSTRVAVEYRPTGLVPMASLSLLGLVAAGSTIAVSCARSRRQSGGLVQTISGSQPPPRSSAA